MHASAPAPTQTELPQVPLTIEGASVLHQMMRFRWNEWRKLGEAEQSAILAEAASALAAFEQRAGGQSALYSLLGHKGDFLFVHFRKDFQELQAAEFAVAKLRLSEYLEPSSSYLSIVELGLYESTAKTYRALQERGIVQVSMNLTNFEKTPIFRVFDTVKREAERYGVAVVESEIVGLVPSAALTAAAGHYLQLERFTPEQVLENKLRLQTSNLELKT